MLVSLNSINLQQIYNNKYRHKYTKKTITQNNTNASLQTYLQNLSSFNKLGITFGSQTETDRVIKRYKEFKPHITPDKYQILAAEAIERGDSLVLTAPTGTGKTLVGEYAIHKNMENGNRTYYTTPLKALTNQKLYDFTQEFADVGIMTGDIKHNITMPTIVMTTEIYQNMLSSSQQDNETMPDKPHSVVVDEFHYMNDTDRGAAWEEAIMLSPSDTQLIALSATVANSDKITQWMQHINPSKHVTSIDVPPEERHVPLKFYSFDASGMSPMFSKKIDLKELSKTLHLENIPDRTNQILEELAQYLHPDKKSTPQEGLSALLELYHYDTNAKIDTDDLISKLETQYIPKEDAEKIALTLANITTPLEKSISPYPKKKGDTSKINSEAVNSLLDHLHGIKKSDSSKMPAIVFVFSKKDCERLAEEYSDHIDATRSKLDSKKVKKKHQQQFAQTSRREKRERMELIKQKIKEYEDNGIVLGTEFNNKARKCLYNGVAIHNAGMLPGYKRLIEELFRDRLIDVVFSTETLSAGINMPAKTTVLTSLYKPVSIPTEGTDGIKRRPLTANEYQQMTGRAGRRGIDKVGNVIILSETEKDYKLAQQLAVAEPDKITSKLDMSYRLLINLLKKNNGHYSSEMADEFLDRSFLVFNSDNPQETKNKSLKKLNGLKNIMEELGFIEKRSDGTYNIPLKGSLVSDVRGTNELLLSELIAGGMFFGMAPEDMAGIVGSLCAPQIYQDPHKSNQSGRKKQQNEENLDLIKSFDILKKEGQKINNLQLKYLGLDSLSDEIHIDSNYAKYIMQWAQPSENNSELWKNTITEMEDKGLIKFEGDFFKSIKSTINLLRQVEKLSQDASKQTEGLESQYYNDVASTAEQAIELLNKSPVKDDLISEQ